MDSLKRIAALNKEAELAQRADIKHQENQMASKRTQEAIMQSFDGLIKYLENRVSRTQVVNQLKEIGTPDALKVVDAVNDLHKTLKTHENTDLSEITKVMKQVLEEAKKIPKSHQDIDIPQPIDHSKQFSSLEKAVKALEKTVKAQKLVAEAPIVNVPQAKVEVQPPDLKPLQTSIKDVVAAVQGIVIPETDTKEVQKLIKASNKLLKEILEKPVGGGGGGGGRATPYQDSNDIPHFVTVESDGSIPVTVKSGGSGSAAFSDSGGVDRKGLVDADRHLQVDVLSMPAGGSGLTDSELRATPVPVSGTITANLSATDNAVLDAIEADTTTLAGAVSGTEMQVDVVTSALPTGASTSANQTTIIGHVDGIESLLTTIDADTGAIKTAVETIDNAISGSEMQVDVITMPTVTTTPTAGTPYFDSDGDNTAQTMKGSAGTLIGLEVSNPNSSACYIQLFDEAGAITVGTTAPKQSYYIPASGAMDKPDIRISFTNSIKYACTTTATGSTDPTTGLVVNGVYI